MGILTPLSTTVMRGSTTLSSPLESITSSFEQYLTSTSSGKLYFLLNSVSLSRSIYHRLKLTHNGPNENERGKKRQKLNLKDEEKEGLTV